MGTVYEAVHTDLKKRVAFKALHTAYADSSQTRLRFLQEGELASRIRHPNVVEIFDVGVENKTPYLVMELLEGEDLASLLERKNRLSPSQIAHVLLPVVAAVATVHDEGILHRDLKPENIFLARHRHGIVQPKLLDFGISKLTDKKSALSLTLGATVVGTPQYMSPEQLTNSKTIDARTDQYSLGVIMYECATGKRPFEGDTLYTLMHNIVAGNFAQPTSLRPELPADFETMILRAMGGDAQDRYPNLISVGRVLLQFAGQRDRAVWAPAFGQGRASGTPLHPSLAPGELSGLDAEQQPAVRAPAERLNKPDHDVPRLDTHELELPGRVPRRRVPLALVAGTLTVVGAGATAMLLSHSKGEPSATAAPDTRRVFRAEVRAVPAHARMELDGRSMGYGSLAAQLAVDGTEHTLRVSADGFEPQELKFRDQPPPRNITLSRRLPPGAGLSAPSFGADDRANNPAARRAPEDSSGTQQESQTERGKRGLARLTESGNDAGGRLRRRATPAPPDESQQGSARARTRDEHNREARARDRYAEAEPPTELEPAPLPEPEPPPQVETSANQAPILE
ncbi:MAG: protein kinase [Proteobacteria bacterium]|nr:protein kinase [Pseudomonadota bacterium]